MSIKTQIIYKVNGPLKNKTFMLTGKLENMSRAEAKSLIEKNSGSIVSNVSKKLNYLIIGNKQSEALNNLSCPVGFMYGENSAEFDTGGNALEEMLELLPETSPVIELKDAQHHLMLDKPLEFVEELDKLIKELI